MDDRWIRNDHEDGRLIHIALPDGTLRLHRDMWEHDCLEVGPGGKSATHRSQGGSQDDDPRSWASQEFEIRRSESGWQMLATMDVIERWRRASETDVQRKETFSKNYTNTIRTDQLEPARSDLEKKQALDAGWIDLAGDVSDLLDRELGTEP